MSATDDYNIIVSLHGEKGVSYITAWRRGLENLRGKEGSYKTEDKKRTS
jgi:hypothetical protein